MMIFKSSSRDHESSRGDIEPFDRDSASSRRDEHASGPAADFEHATFFGQEIGERFSSVDRRFNVC